MDELMSDLLETDRLVDSALVTATTRRRLDGARGAEGTCDDDDGDDKVYLEGKHAGSRKDGTDSLSSDGAKADATMTALLGVDEFVDRGRLTGGRGDGERKGSIEIGNPIKKAASNQHAGATGARDEPYSSSLVSSSSSSSAIMLELLQNDWSADRAAQLRRRRQQQQQQHHCHQQELATCGATRSDQIVASFSGHARAGASASASGVGADVAALSQLLEVDRAVDGARTASASDAASSIAKKSVETEEKDKEILASLLAVDAQVDRVSGAKGRKHVGGDDAKNAKDEKKKGVDPFDVSVPTEIDAPPDVALDDTVGVGGAAGGVDVLSDLLAVDREIDAASAATRPQHKSSSKARTRTYTASDRKADAEAATATAIATAAAIGSDLDGVFAELYAVDARFAGAADSKVKKDGVSCLAELIEVDRFVCHLRRRNSRRFSRRRINDRGGGGGNNEADAAAAHNDNLDDDDDYDDDEGDIKFRNMLDSLLAVDQIVDVARYGKSYTRNGEENKVVAGGDNHPKTKTNKDGVAPFHDPYTDQILAQYRTLASSLSAGADDNITALSDVLDLLDVDREIDCSRAYRRAVHDLGPLYEVDAYVDGARTRRRRKDGTDALAELLNVDRFVDGFVAARAAAADPATIAAGSNSNRKRENVTAIDKARKVEEEDEEGKNASKEKEEEEEEEEEKKMDESHDPMAALLAVDRLIDGAVDYDKEKEYLRRIAEFVKLDRAADAAFSIQQRGDQERGRASAVQKKGMDEKEGAVSRDDEDEDDDDDDDIVNDILPPPSAPTESEDADTAGGGGGGNKTRSIFSAHERKSAASYESSAMNAVRHLLEVDRSVDWNRKYKSLGVALEDVSDLLAVDREIDGARRAEARKMEIRHRRRSMEEAEQQEQQQEAADWSLATAQERKRKMGDAAYAAATAPPPPPPPPKRSIFSTKEKEGAATTSSSSSNPNGGKGGGMPAPPTVVIGTTTVIRKHAKMIGSIPVGENLQTQHLKDEFFGTGRPSSSSSSSAAAAAAATGGRLDRRTANNSFRHGDGFGSVGSMYGSVSNYRGAATGGRLESQTSDRGVAANACGKKRWKNKIGCTVM